MKTVISLTIILISIMSTSFGQSQARSEFAQKFNFDKSTDEKEITLEVKTGTEMVGFEFTSEITGGHLIMTILDPNGKKEGGFELEAVESKGDGRNHSSSSNRNSNDNSHTYTMVTTDGGNAHGMLNKQIDNPVAGTWKVKIKSKTLSGLVAIKVAQMSDD